MKLSHTVKLLGVHLSSDLKWSTHINVCSKVSKRLFALRILKRSGAVQKDLRNVYCSFIRPVLEYACPVWHFSLAAFLSDQMEQIQRGSVKMICPGLSYMDGLKELNFSTPVDHREFLCKKFYVNSLSSSSNISDLLPKKTLHLYNFRNDSAF